VKNINSVNFEWAYRNIIRFLNNEGQIASPRNMLIKEISPFSFSIEAPLSRLITWNKRNLNIFCAFGELLWIMSGSENLNMIVPFNKGWERFSDDGHILNGAYGKRLINKDGNQINQIIEILKADKDSRQAIMHVHNQADLFIKSKDIPCTSSLQFFIREGRLNCITYMRSNDIILGTAYDVFVFTMIQEYIAKKLDVKLGEYTHIAGSMHIYSTHFDYFNFADEHILMADIITMPIMNIEEFDMLLEYYIAIANDCQFGISFKKYVGHIDDFKTSYCKDIYIMILIKMLNYNKMISDTKELINKIEFKPYIKFIERFIK